MCVCWGEGGRVGGTQRPRKFREEAHLQPRLQGGQLAGLSLAELLQLLQHLLAVGQGVLAVLQLLLEGKHLLLVALQSLYLLHLCLPITNFVEARDEHPA